jgi:hypothetical protein
MRESWEEQSGSMDDLVHDAQLKQLAIAAEIHSTTPTEKEPSRLIRWTEWLFAPLV